MKYSSGLVKKLFGIDSDDFLCSSLGDLSHKDDFGVLSYISSDKYLLDLHSNSSIKAVFVSKGVSDQVDEKIIKIIERSTAAPPHARDKAKSVPFEKF